MPKKTCSVEGCEKSSWSKGFCSAHLYHFNRHGDPLAGGTRHGEPLRFLEEVVLPFEGDDCIAWPFTTDQNGYGQIYINGKVRRVNGVICERTIGPSPSPAHVVAHSCGKGHERCCSPRHMSWKTQKENMADAQRHGTWNHGEKVPQSKLTADDVEKILALKGYMLQREIAKKFGVSQPLVSRLHNGELWATIPRNG